MGKLNFISFHIINKIDEEIVNKTTKIENMSKDSTRTSTSEMCFYFDEPIRVGNKEINRIRRTSALYKLDSRNIKWEDMSGKTLLEIYDRMKNNKFYVYKFVFNKYYIDNYPMEKGETVKLRIKNNVLA